MNRAVFFLKALLCIAVLLSPAISHAWLFGESSSSSRSGLDLVQGYDRNTVVTLTGRVAASHNPASDPVTMELLVGSEMVTVVLGPRWYLQDDDLDWKAGSSVTVRGAKAQGKDGRTYLLTQSITTPGSGQMVLRNESGRPSWSGGGGGGQWGKSGVERGAGAGIRRGR